MLTFSWIYASHVTCVSLTFSPTSSRAVATFGCQYMMCLGVLYTKLYICACISPPPPPPPPLLPPLALVKSHQQLFMAGSWSSRIRQGWIRHPLPNSPNRPGTICLAIDLGRAVLLMAWDSFRAQQCGMSLVEVANNTWNCLHNQLQINDNNVAAKSDSVSEPGDWNTGHWQSMSTPWCWELPAHSDTGGRSAAIKTAMSFSILIMVMTGVKDGNERYMRWRWVPLLLLNQDRHTVQ